MRFNVIYITALIQKPAYIELIQKPVCKKFVGLKVH